MKAEKNMQRDLKRSSYPHWVWQINSISQHALHMWIMIITKYESLGYNSVWNLTMTDWDISITILFWSVWDPCCTDRQSTKQTTCKYSQPLHPISNCFKFTIGIPLPLDLLSKACLPVRNAMLHRISWNKSYKNQNKTCGSVKNNSIARNVPYCT